jgi:hypothetical protein
MPTDRIQQPEPVQRGLQLDHLELKQVQQCGSELGIKGHVSFRNEKRGSHRKTAQTTRLTDQSVGRSGDDYLTFR